MVSCVMNYVGWFCLHGHIPVWVYCLVGFGRLMPVEYESASDHTVGVEGTHVHSVCVPQRLVAYYWVSSWVDATMQGRPLMCCIVYHWSALGFGALCTD